MSYPGRAAPAQRDNEPFFHHGVAIERPDSDATGVTRYLCGAAYLDETYPDRVIDELIADPQRAVVPAHGFDVEPVVRHCFRAQRIWLMQSGWVCAVLIVSAFVAGWATVLVVGAAVALALPAWANGRARRPPWKVVAGGVLALFVLGCLAGPMLTALPLLAGLGGQGLDPAPIGAAGSSGLGGLLLKALLITAFILMGLTWARRTMLRTLAVDLAPGADGRPPDVPSGPIAARLAEVAAAQRGNILMQTPFDPFLGAGEVVANWSVAMELKPNQDPLRRRADESEWQAGWTGRQPDGSAAQQVVPIDAVELCRHVKRRVAALRGETLPQAQRIAGLTLRDQIIAAGTHWRDYELIDSYRRPYSFAAKEAVDAITRHPQASARHVLRVVVSADGSDVDVAGRTALAAVSQGIVVSTFTHLAVEGGMLYIEHTTAVLGPLHPRLYDIDQYSPHSDGLGWDAFVDALSRFGTSTVTAPWHLIRSALSRIRLNRGLAGDGGAVVGPVNQFGARKDIREMASVPVFQNVLQRLDADKYQMLVNRRISEAVIEYLEDQGIDTSEYRARANVVQDLSTHITNSTIGQNVVGGAGTVTARPPVVPKERTA